MVKKWLLEKHFFYFILTKLTTKKNIINIYK